MNERKPNPKQLEAIEYDGGNLLIVAGPGTGKTFTLIERVKHLIENEQDLKPEQILLCTFTQKAAAELQDRLHKAIPNVNIHEMLIGTIHELCMALIRDNVDKTGLGKGFHLMNEFEQQYLIYSKIATQNFWSEGNTWLGERSRGNKIWSQAKKANEAIQEMREAMISVELLEQYPESPECTFGARLLKAYEDILRDEHLLDFSGMQIEAYNLLKNNPDIARQLEIKHILIDEFQDTNPIQIEILNLLANESTVFCAVGDDDQSLYRFRGAEVDNILNFENDFNAHRITLIENYRSHPDIIRAQNSFVEKTTTSYSTIRLRKDIQPGKERYERNISAPAALKVPIEEGQELSTVVQGILEELNLQDPSHAVFLMYSVKDTSSLIKELKSAGLLIHSPRDKRYFFDDIVLKMIGVMIKAFGRKSKDLKQRRLVESFTAAGKLGYKNGFFKSLPQDVKTYSELFYRLLSLPVFKEAVNQYENQDLVKRKDLHSLALFSGLITQFEKAFKVSEISPENTDSLIYEYLSLLASQGLNGYEDDQDITPKGAHTFQTIHQSKGLEFPIVFVIALENYPRRWEKKLDEPIKNPKLASSIRYQVRPHDFLHTDYISSHDKRIHDYFRKYYTAFSRAQDQLFILYPDHKDLSLENVDDDQKNSIIAKMEQMDNFKKIEAAIYNPEKHIFEKDPTIKEREVTRILPELAFTSHLSIYQDCPLRYLLFRELGFSPSYNSSAFFGTLVHQSMEKILTLIKEDPGRVIDSPLVTMVVEEEALRLFFSENIEIYGWQKEEAAKQVYDYIRKLDRSWIYDPEIELKIELPIDRHLVTIKGTIDLICKDGNTIELVDFKTSRSKPKKGSLTEKHHQEQLKLYKYLYEKNHREKVKKLTLYYTGHDNPEVDVPIEGFNEEEYLKKIEKLVRGIVRRDFTKTSSVEEVCKFCDFRFFCDKQKI